MKGRPPTIRDKVLAALRCCPDPLGATHGYLAEASASKRKAVTMVLLALKASGTAFALGKNRYARYFATAELRDAAAPALAEFLEEQRRIKRRQQWKNRKLSPAAVERRRLYDERRAEALKARRAAKRAALPPKPAKVKAPKLTAPTSHASPFKTVTQPRPANRESSAKKRWAEMEPIYPVHADGSPAYRVVIAPSPPAVVYRTNTHSR